MNFDNRSRPLKQGTWPRPPAHRLTIVLPPGQDIKIDPGSSNQRYSGETSPKRLHLAREETAEGRMILVTRERGLSQNSPWSSSGSFMKDPDREVPSQPCLNSGIETQSSRRRKSSLVPSYYQETIDDSNGSMTTSLRTSCATAVPIEKEQPTTDALEWQEFDVPLELEALPPHVPERVRSVVQESFDKHRATRALRHSHKHAIVVRTTITQETSSVENVSRPIFAESSAMASNRSLLPARRQSPTITRGRPRSSVSETMSSASSPLAADSNTSLSSDEDVPSTSPAKNAHSEVQESFILTKNQMTLQRKPEISAQPSADRNFFGKILTSTKSRESEQETPKELVLVKCTGCFNEAKYEDAVNLPCEHHYCSSCLSYFIRTACLNNSIFPPSCCHQEIQRKLLASYLRSDEVVAYDSRCLEYAVTEPERVVEAVHAGTVTQIVEAVEASEPYLKETKRLEDERSAERARIITAKESSRLEPITEFFEYLRGVLEEVRRQQRSKIKQRHECAQQEFDNRRSAILSGEMFAPQRQQAQRDRAVLAARNDAKIKAVHEAHSAALVETISRHRRDQDSLLAAPSTSPIITAADSATPLDQLMKAQDEERTTLQSMQTREVKKWKKRHELLLHHLERQLADTEAGEELAATRGLEIELQQAEKVRKADWKWFDIVFLDRALMLGEDERRMILSGDEAPADKSDRTVVGDQVSHGEPRGRHDVRAGGVPAWD